MYGILSDFIYWLNSNILSFFDTIPQKSFYIFFMRFKFTFCSKKTKTIQLIKFLLVKVIPCKNVDIFLQQHNAVLLFPCLESLIE